MFVNSNGYHLGMREGSTMVCDVDLPAWAKKPEDLVRIDPKITNMPENMSRKKSGVKLNSVRSQTLWLSQQHLMQHSLVISLL